MAKDKKSFLMYCDSISMIEKLSDERAGKLIKHIFRYCNDLNPVSDDEVVDMAFEHFKSILKRDLLRYNNIVERNKNNGLKGGRPKKEETKQKQENPVGYLETQLNPIKPKKADTDNDTDTDILLKKETKGFLINLKTESYYSFEEFWSIYPKKIAKDKCKEKYEKLVITDKQNIKETLSVFINHKPFKEYTHPNPLTYLNQKRWKDEIEINQNNLQNGKSKIVDTYEFKQIAQAIRQNGGRK